MATRDEPGQFAVLLQAYRVVACLSQQELAERAGLSRRGISDLERGQRRAPHPATVRRLSEALGLTHEARAALLASAHPLATSARRPQNPALPPLPLPLPLTDFVGRERELADLRRLLDSTRLLTLVGTGGVGKTRLALQLAANVSRGNARGVLWVDLAAVTELASVSRTIAVMLGLAEQPGRAQVDALAEALQQKRVALLLVLDGCDHVASACAELVDRLILRCPGVSVLASGRAPLGSASETSWEVPPLSLPPLVGSVNVWGPPRILEGQEDAAVEQVADSDAVRLFVMRASAARTAYTLTGRHASAIAQLCRDLEGIPLALEVAAARVASLPLEHIAEQLRNAIQPLTSGRHSPLPQAQTLHTTLDWSYKLLSAEARRLLAALSVFGGGWTLTAAQAICIRGGFGADVELRCLEELVATRLVTPETGGDGSCRYRLHDSVRQYANQRIPSVSRGC